MFSKQEIQVLKKDFWTSFGKSFPQKWILYNTKIKDFSFKFYCDAKMASVSLELEMRDETLRKNYLDKIRSLESVLQEKLGNFYMEQDFILENGKTISKIWVEKTNVSIYNKNTWQEVFLFFVEKMQAFESVFLDYEDYIKDV